MQGTYSKIPLRQSNFSFPGEFLLQKLTNDTDIALFSDSRDFETPCSFVEGNNFSELVEPRLSSRSYQFQSKFLYWYCTYLRTSRSWRRVRDSRHPKYRTRCRTCRDARRKPDLSKRGLRPSLVTRQAPRDSCASFSLSRGLRANWTDGQKIKESRRHREIAQSPWLCRWSRNVSSIVRVQACVFTWMCKNAVRSYVAFQYNCINRFYTKRLQPFQIPPIEQRELRKRGIPRVQSTSISSENAIVEMPAIILRILPAISRSPIPSHSA